MATRKASDAMDEAGPAPLRAGMPTRLLPFDWPFLYSLMPNGDLVLNKRLPPAPAAQRRGAASADGRSTEKQEP